MILRLIVLVGSMASLADAQGPLRFELKQLERKTPNCVITIEYPEIVSAATPQARDRINAGIRRVLLQHTEWPERDSGLPSIDAYAKEFMTHCAEYQEGPQRRELYQHKMVTIFRYTPPVLSVKCDADEDGGGVHPYGTTLFVNFESSTGRTLGITDFIREDALPKLESMAEGIFRRDRKLSPTEGLSEQSYQFPGDRFRLNDNFGIGERELVFLFNTYEIGPGAMGATEITIPHVFLRGLLKPGLHLW
jgi:hypothetical protein